ncbi:nuclear transport factor 2 family protein [Massilia sp. PAMC28688]|uniref:nuclear transport factor 2 family protein n=1 Tax=Massilia sp. PAMC28688 TaxID=2861283 RepID=UPI001C629D66|nr:nuclear transport factor 2 family protein [Massilia sp. PAMC28688]QYF95049.1 nuclear transport factor 2 family protein [Massilia sp. PAMC28688]
MTERDHPAAVVQRQLDAYNARDIDALVGIYADDARQYELPGTLVASGSAQIRERMQGRLQEPNLHARLVQRAVMGNIVIDQEVVTRTFPEGPGSVDIVAIYEVVNGRIQSASVQVSNKRLHG